MAKIPFDIKYRPQIESGEYKVETRDGKPVRVICWDMNSYNHIVALVANYPNYNGSVSEHIFSYSMDGRYNPSCSSAEDLFLIAPEPELTEFEKRLVEFYNDGVSLPCDKDGMINKREADELLHKAANELLSLAREQFIKDGYVIEKKAFHDAVEKVDPEVMKEVSDNYLQIALRTEYEKGRDEALKDLPKWKKCGKNILRPYDEEHFEYRRDGNYFVAEGMEILLSDLKKLPKEDEK